MTRTDGIARVSAERWRAVIARDARTDERFVYAVRTTGVYCRPGCRSRCPNRKNVEFFDTAAQARAAGYRACRRCRPDEPDAREPMAARLMRACRFIDDCDSPPRLAEIAEYVGLSPHYFHRVFRDHLGVTPKAYASARRVDKLKGALKEGGPMTNAIYAAGYESSGRCYAEAQSALGMTPKQYQDGGREVRIRFAIVSCTLGRVLVAVTAKGVCRIDFGDDDVELAEGLRAAFPDAEQTRPDTAFAALLEAVVSFIERPSIRRDFPLDILGTAFQRRIWEAISAIPVGETRSYTELALVVGQPGASRAAASACAANPLAVAVPCHRVVRTDGTLGGYRWGLKRKEALLDREATLKPRKSRIKT